MRLNLYLSRVISAPIIITNCKIYIFIESTRRTYHIIVERPLSTKYYCQRFGSLITKEASGTQVLGNPREALPRQRTLTQFGAGQAPDILKTRNPSTTLLFECTLGKDHSSGKSCVHPPLGCHRCRQPHKVSNSS